QNNGSNGDKRPEKPSGNNDGPPDLDQLWRDFNQRIAGLLGRKGGGGSDGGNGGGGFNRGDVKGAGIGVGVIAVIVAFLWL
ncbi:protease modulator HflK N-terminal domain-containing protein, partial [Escherichia coli]